MNFGQFPSRNTVGDVPLEWYKDEPHIGYDRSGQKILKKKRRDQLDTFLARTDDSKDWLVAPQISQLQTGFWSCCFMLSLIGQVHNSWRQRLGLGLILWFFSRKTVYDEYNDEEIKLTKEEIRMIRRLREGKIPHAQVNPYEVISRIFPFPFGSGRSSENWSVHILFHPRALAVVIVRAHLPSLAMDA